MTITLNHTIVFVRDKKESSGFLTGLFGLPPAKPFGPFLAVQVGDVTLDFDEVEDPSMGHYAFLVSEDEFDEIFGRIQERGLDYFADPQGQEKGEIDPSIPSHVAARMIFGMLDELSLAWVLSKQTSISTGTPGTRPKKFDIVRAADWVVALVTNGLDRSLKEKSP